MLCWKTSRREEGKVGQTAFNACLRCSFSFAIRLSRRRYTCRRFAVIRSRCSAVNWGQSGVVDVRLKSLVLSWGVEFAWFETEKINWDEASKSSLDFWWAAGDGYWGVDLREVAWGAVECGDWGSWLGEDGWGTGRAQSLEDKMSVGVDGEDDILKAKNMRMMGLERRKKKHVLVEEREKLKWWKFYARFYTALFCVLYISSRALIVDNRREQLSKALRFRYKIQRYF